MKQDNHGHHNNNTIMHVLIIIISMIIIIKDLNSAISLSELKRVKGKVYMGTTSHSLAIVKFC